MNLKIYRDPYSESYQHVVGHLNTMTGMVYRDPYSESYSACVGHVRNGIVYSDAASESAMYRVGQYSADGKIYKDPYSRSAGNCIGHINTNGVIYKEPYSESSYCAWGHVENNRYSPAAAAAFLLLLPR